MSRLTWYWNRLRAMAPAEIAAHVRKRFCHWSDEQELPDWSAPPLDTEGGFPSLPPSGSAPPELREALQRDVVEILAGRWKAFGYLELKVDDPPRWQSDYLAGRDLETDEAAFHLDHRRLPGGADIKLIWELSRWHHLVRLAQAAYVLGDRRAGQKCVEWLGDWVKHNPPCRGWNWTSTLEVGMRLVQFTWIDALLGAGTAESAPGEGDPDTRTRLSALRRDILPAHVWHAWRYRSFGSSANNHLLGELSGLILAVARWPELIRWAAPLDVLQRLWECEVEAQFAEDGGNREQALNYHLFSWEFCWQAQAALRTGGREIRPEVAERLRRAACFFVAAQVEGEAWDYGDSDNAFGTPFFLDGKNPAAEWRDWFRHPDSSPAIDYWWGNVKASRMQGAGFKFNAAAGGTGLEGGWQIFSESGIAMSRSGQWTLRWDVSSLGYLATAAHGHLDALHLSIWFRGIAMVIDPGTGAYYAEKELRTYLSSWPAHNGPHPSGLDFPKRLGPFLWSAHHAEPNLKPGSDASLTGELRSPSGRVTRTVIPAGGDQGWRVDDAFHPYSGRGAFSVRWQFAPGAKLARVAERKFRLARAGGCIEIEASGDWAEVYPVAERNSAVSASIATPERETALAGTVSPAFRKKEWAPFLELRARGHEPCVFRTTFLACDES